jgi:hypothetical protein
VAEAIRDQLSGIARPGIGAPQAMPLELFPAIAGRAPERARAAGRGSRR